MDCSKRDKLLEDYYSATKDYNEILERMIHLQGAELEEARPQSQLLRALCDARAQALTDHQQEHGC
jgi:hypothetical protein